jgi:regulatory LacI family protein
MNGMRHTIHDIADIAGVSSTTVSRVLNESKMVSSKTRSRVQAVISDLQYRPNAHAIELVRSRSQQKRQSEIQGEPIGDGRSDRWLNLNAIIRSSRSYESELELLRKENSRLRSIVADLSLEVATQRRYITTVEARTALVGTDPSQSG